MVKDLTVGDPFRTLWQFTLPMLLSMACQQLYQVADAVIAGRCIHMDALGAVGASHPITTLFLSVASGLSLGASVVISRHFGAKEREMVGRAVSTALRAVMAIAVVVMVLGLPLSGALLDVLNTPVELVSGGRLYLQIYVLGLPFLFLYNLANGIFHALGDSKTPLYVLMASSGLNLILDLAFVAGLRWGIFGLAFATWIAQGVAAGIAAATAVRRVRALCPRPGCAFDWPLLKAMLGVGIPSIIQQSCTSLGQMSIQGVINACGHGVVAGYSAAFKLNTLVIMTLNTLSNGVSSYVAQNLGAKNYARIRQGMQAAAKLMFVTAAVVAAALFAGSPVWIQGFLGGEEGSLAMQAGVSFLRTVSPFYLLVCFKIVADGALRGMGAMKEFMTANFADLLLRVALAPLMSRGFGYPGIWWVWPMAWLAGTGLSVMFYRKRMRFFTASL